VFLIAVGVPVAGRAKCEAERMDAQRYRADDSCKYVSPPSRQSECLSAMRGAARAAEQVLRECEQGSAGSPATGGPAPAAGDRDAEMKAVVKGVMGFFQQMAAEEAEKEAEQRRRNAEAARQREEQEARQREDEARRKLEAVKRRVERDKELESTFVDAGEPEALVERLCTKNAWIVDPERCRLQEHKTASAGAPNICSESARLANPARCAALEARPASQMRADRLNDPIEYHPGGARALQFDGRSAPSTQPVAAAQPSIAATVPARRAAPSANRVNEPIEYHPGGATVLGFFPPPMSAEELAKRCPSPPARQSAVLAVGAEEDEAMWQAMTAVLDACYPDRTEFCSDKQVACQLQRERVKNHQDTEHDHDPYVRDIRTEWLGQKYPGAVELEECREHNVMYCGGVFDEEVHSVEELSAFIGNRRCLADKHRRVQADWNKWLTWASAISQECVAKHQAKSAN